MKFSPWHASLLALALFSSAGVANAAGESPEPMVVAQATDVSAVEKFLAATRDVSQLDEQRLQQRLSRAKKFREAGDLPPDIDAQLQQTISALEAELAKRQEAAQASPQAPATADAGQQDQGQPQQKKHHRKQAEQAQAQQDQQQAQPEQQPQADQQPQAEQPPVTADAQPQDQGQPQQKKHRRKQAEQAQVQQDQQQAQTEQPQAQPEASQGSPEVAAFLQSVRPASELNEEQLRQQMQQAMEMSQAQGISPEQRNALRNVIKETRTALRSAGQNAGQQAAQPQETPAAPSKQKQVQQQAEQPQAQPEASQGSPEVAAFLQSVRPASELNEEQLRQQMQQAMEMSQAQGISPEQRNALRNVIKETRTALRSAGQNAGQQVAQPQETPAAPSKQKQVQQQAEQPQAQPGAAQGSPEVAAFLQSVRPASELNEEQLRQQMQQAMELSQAQGISPEQRTSLREVIKDTRTALRSAGQAGGQQAAQPTAPKQPEQPAQQQQAEQPPAQTTASPEIAAFLQTVRPAAELNQDQIRQQMQKAMELSQTEGLPPQERRALRDVIKEARTALADKGGTTEQAQQPPVQQQAVEPPAPKPQTEQQLANPTNVDAALEAQAKAMLNDKVDPRTLKKDELRQRLNTMRDLLVTNQLSVDTREALREKLATEREVLRTQVALEEGTAPPVTNNTANTTVTNNNVTITNNNTSVNNTTNNTTNNTANTTVNNVNTNVNNAQVQVVLKDRRPPDQLNDDELVRRIDIYRNVVADDRYAEDERMQWRQQMEDDRRFLRRRMIEERSQREARLRAGNIQLNFRIEDSYDPRREVPDDAFAAEVDDSQIADVLTAPPRRQIQRRYTVDDIERSPEARNAVARVEIDTVHFGFGEGFLREEEIDKLDRIAQVLEKILAKHPDEVFLLEGHTDAVGSDQSNLLLSKQRAEAVKQALVTYYVIPPENLKTVGLGERYLKIPTDRPEPENRRVSLARITALVGQR